MWLFFFIQRISLLTGSMQIEANDLFFVRFPLQAIAAGQIAFRFALLPTDQPTSTWRTRDLCQAGETIPTIYRQDSPNTGTSTCCVVSFDIIWISKPMRKKRKRIRKYSFFVISTLMRGHFSPRPIVPVILVIYIVYSWWSGKYGIDHSLCASLSLFLSSRVYVWITKTHSGHVDFMEGKEKKSQRDNTEDNRCRCGVS